MILTPDVEFILKRLNEKGHRADVVGGPVRDFLRGVTPSDYDITTSATPEETKAAFSDFKTVDTGIKHGTVTLVLNSTPYEITTYRIDGEYTDSRHPDSVTFTRRIEEDLSRRDFTVNAISYNPRDGITDPFFGREDIEKRIIRAVGDPYLRFSEDALRILRALRFSSSLGFEIEENTAKALVEKSCLLTEISAERIFIEWKKLLSGDGAFSVLSRFSSVLTYFLPELKSLVLPADAALSEDFLVRQAAIFYLSCENPSESYKSAMLRLKTDSFTRDMGGKMLDNVGKYKLLSLSDAGFMLKELGAEAADYTVRLEAVLGKKTKEQQAYLSEYLERGLPYKVGDLKIDGNALRSLGLRGREIGVCLDKLLSAVIFGRVKNEEAALLAYIKSN